MRFRIGLAVGFAAGYVLGAKAGHGRYEEIVDLAQSFMGSQTARHLEGGLRDAWESAKDEFPVVNQVGQQMGTVLDLHDKLDTAD